MSINERNLCQFIRSRMCLV